MYKILILLTYLHFYNNNDIYFYICIYFFFLFLLTFLYKITKFKKIKNKDMAML